MKKLQVGFGKPIHNWLPVHLITADFELEFEASAIPENPVEQLVEALMLVLQGINADVFWNLEPLKYIFEFTVEQKNVVLIIKEKRQGSVGKEITRVKGDFQSIVLPFWRAIKVLGTSQHSLNRQWPVLSAPQLKRLDNRITQIKSS